MGAAVSHEALVEFAGLSRRVLGAREQRSGMFVRGHRNSDVAEYVNAAEAEVRQRRFEGVQDGASQVDAGAGVAMGDQGEMTRAEVAEVVFGRKLR